MTSEAQPIARPPRGGGAKPSRLVLAAYPLGAIALAIIAWAAVVRIFKIKPYIIPAPETVFFTFVDRFGLLSYHAVPTLLETILGLISASPWACRSRSRSFRRAPWNGR